jgi:hypothetical protein
MKWDIIIYNENSKILVNSLKNETHKKNAQSLKFVFSL